MEHAARAASYRSSTARGCRLFMENKVKIIFIGLLILAGILVRLIDLGEHFTHVDDIGVAKSILNAKAPYSIPMKEEGMDDAKIFMADAGIKGSLPFWDQVVSISLNLLEKVMGAQLYKAFASQARKLFAVSRAWTYAPLQFFITYFLIETDQSYREKIFWGRFPSFLFGVGGLFLIVWFYAVYDRLKTP
ncbi:MAG: hypothetical protein NC930_03075, partial [Candidatus Omnitrophica bacterium]|nr:hypothetical protein [Candidatus Omnitrophota bacterium]